MTPAAALEAARVLLAARRERRPVAALPEACRPKSVEEGYLVQSALIAESGEVAVGYKIGATSARAQSLLKVSEPFFGRVLQSRLFNSPAEILGDAFISRLLESEFAFRMGAALAPRSASYSAAEVGDAVAAVHPSFEIVTSGLDDWMSQGVPSLIADNGVHGALVLGPATEDWRDIDLAAQEVVLEVNGAEHSRGKGANALGGPLLALAWLANTLSEQGLGLAAGDFVTTGLVTDIVELEVGDEAAAHYGALGQIRIRIR